MSLKIFHLAFIALSSLLALLLAVYAFTTLAGPMRFVWSLAAIVSAGIIVYYGLRFRRKMRDAAFQ